MTKTISELKIGHYRGIDDFVLADLGQINVLVGANNIGKTSILEAIGLLSNPLDRPNFLKWVIMRTKGSSKLSQKVPDYLEFLFSGNRKISLEANIRNQQNSVTYEADVYSGSTPSGERYKAADVIAVSNEKKATLSFKSNGRSSYKGSDGIFTTEEIITNESFYQNCVDHISESMLYERKAMLLEVIQSFDTDVLDIMLKNDDILLHSKSSGVQPLFHYGNGLQKAVLLAAALLNAENNVILVDEIDNAINLAAFQEIFPWFIQKCYDRNVQAFITTHSMEAIDAIIKASEKTEQDDLRIITLRRSPKTNRVIPQIRTREEASYDRENFKMEMRL